jgi:hypothetical protein
MCPSNPDIGDACNFSIINSWQTFPPFSLKIVFSGAEI